jgi:hypothetical protein
MNEEPLEEYTVVIVDDVTVSYSGVQLWPPSTAGLLLVGSLIAVSVAVSLLVVFLAVRRRPEQPSRSN